ncbi:acyl-CoA synthetase [Rhizocola hellebori]|uniref:Acyl-CoA synthetase n=1 Tax=Rhizocola hellebori TaxID=1392758 RepID=A0A8J3QA16_9ACTN|nr:AMP-binding protein [Rhizocola hellebori]GIH06705.1 acyl-CoA synthetase [Rhizocola hellebori]
MTVADLIRAAAADSADAVGLRCGEQSLTYRELCEAVEHAAAAWQQHGLAPGDRVAVWSANTVDCAIAMLSVIVAGGVLVPLNPRYTTPEAAAILDRSSCRFVAAADRFAGDVSAIVGADRVVTFGGEVPPGGIGWREMLSKAEGLSPRAERGEIAAIQFTSGTTGRPKGAMLRQAPMVSTSATWSQVVGLGRGDVYPVLYPLAHVGGFKTGLVAAIHARATIILVPTVSASSIVELVRGGGITVLNAPPTAQSYVLEARRTGRLPGDLGIRTAVIGSAIVPPALIRGLVDDLGVADVVVAYGLTEATGVCTMTRRNDPIELVCASIGRAIDGVEVRIEPTADDPLIGEIEVRGVNLMAGYLDDPDATAEALHDGWLRTGDLGWIDAQGYVHICGRARDLVIVGGFNVYPAEIEQALIAHPAVREAAVIGVPDERLGEVPAAFVVAQGVSPEDLIAWCRERLANFKIPRHLQLVDDLPRNAMGKVVKAELSLRP